MCELLRGHYAEGRLDLDELDERLSRAVRAKTHGDLRESLQDLPESSAPSPRAPVLNRQSTAPRTSTVHPFLYAAVGLGVTGILGVVTLMILGSLVLGGPVFLFSLIGGSLAAGGGGGLVWLVLKAPRRQERPQLPGPSER